MVSRMLVFNFILLCVFLNAQSLPDSTLTHIVFYREYNFYGGAWGHKIVKGDSTIGILKNNSFFVYTCKPGEFDFQVKRGRYSIHLRTEAVKIYYVRFVFRDKLILPPFQYSAYPDLEYQISENALPAIEKIKSRKSKIWR